jgi:hypothetical protein
MERWLKWLDDLDDLCALAWHHSPQVVTPAVAVAFVTSVGIIFVFGPPDSRCALRAMTGPQADEASSVPSHRRAVPSRRKARTRLHRRAAHNKSRVYAVSSATTGCSNRGRVRPGQGRHSGCLAGDRVRTSMQYGSPELTCANCGPPGHVFDDGRSPRGCDATSILPRSISAGRPYLSSSLAGVVIFARSAGPVADPPPVGTAAPPPPGSFRAARCHSANRVDLRRARGRSRQRHRALHGLVYDPKAVETKGKVRQPRDAGDFSSRSPGKDRRLGPGRSRDARGRARSSHPWAMVIWRRRCHPPGAALVFDVELLDAGRRRRAQGFPPVPGAVVIDGPAGALEACRESASRRHARRRGRVIPTAVRRHRRTRWCTQRSRDAGLSGDGRSFRAWRAGTR